MKESYECKIYFRILFTIYWVGRIVQGSCNKCDHYCYEKLSLFTKEFSSTYNYYWEPLGGGKK